ELRAQPAPSGQRHRDAIAGRGKRCELERPIPEGNRGLPARDLLADDGHCDARQSSAILVPNGSADRASRLPEGDGEGDRKNRDRNEQDPRTHSLSPSNSGGRPRIWMANHRVTKYLGSVASRIPEDFTLLP